MAFRAGTPELPAAPSTSTVRRKSTVPDGSRQRPAVTGVGRSAQGEQLTVIGPLTYAPAAIPPILVYTSVTERGHSRSLATQKWGGPSIGCLSSLLPLGVPMSNFFEGFLNLETI